MGGTHALVVGHGRMGSRHAAVLRELGVKVTTVDVDRFAGADRERVPAGCDAGLAVVSVPPHRLADVASELIATHEVPRVVVDKPMAESLDDARALNALAEAAGTDLMLMFTERANPGFRALRDCLHLVGPVRNISVRRLGPRPANWQCDVGVDIAGHCFDMTRALGFEPEPIWGEAVGGVARYRSMFADGGGALDVLVSHEEDEVVRTFAVTGPGGMLTLDKRSQEVLYYDAEGVSEIPVAREEPLLVAWREVMDGTWVADGRDGEIALELSLTRSDLAPDVPR